MQWELIRGLDLDLNAKDRFGRAFLLDQNWEDNIKTAKYTSENLRNTVYKIREMKAK